MPTPTERLKTIEPRLDVIEKVLGIKQMPPLRLRVSEWLGTHKGLTWGIGLIVAIALVVIPGMSDQKKQDVTDATDRRIEIYMKAPGGVLEKLQQLQMTTAALSAKLDTLTPLIQDVITHQFSTVSKLSPQALGAELPAVTRLIQAADVEGIHVQPQQAVNLSKNLLRVPNDSPGYWLAASQLVSYRSVPATSTPPSSTPCKLHINIDRETGPGPRDVDTHIEVSDCTFDLGDNPSLRGGGFPQAKYLILRNVRVRYNGGSVDDLPATVLFDHCTFDFRINNQPPVPAQRLTNALLAAADLSNLSYSPDRNPA